MSVLVVNDEVMLRHVLDDLEFLEGVVSETTSTLAECEHLDEDQLNDALVARTESELALWRLRNFVEALRT